MFNYRVLYSSDCTYDIHIESRRKMYFFAVKNTWNKVSLEKYHDVIRDGYLKSLQYGEVCISDRRLLKHPKLDILEL